LILSLFGPYRSKLILAFFSVLSANGLELLFPLALKYIIDVVIIGKDLLRLDLLSLALVLVFVLRFCFGFLREYLVSFLGESIVRDLRAKLHLHLQRLSVNYIENTPKGKIISGIIGDVESLKSFLFGGAVEFLYAFLQVLLILAILFALDWRLTLVSVLFLPAFIIAFLKLTPLLQKKHAFLREQFGELTVQVEEFLQGNRIVAGFNASSVETDKFSRTQEKIVKAALSSHRLGIALWMGSEFISSLGMVAVIWLGARLVLSGNITTGTLMAFYAYLGMLFYPVIKIAVINNYYQEACASLARIREILDTEPLIRQSPHALTLERLRGEISFREVRFGYDDKKEVLKGINLDVRAAETLAIVGKSGAGKTTLINLLLRFYDPAAGSVKVDGHDLKALDLENYRLRLAMVIQDDYLFGATVAENIRYAKPSASRQELLQVSRLARAHEFIEGLPDGYDTQIGERGVKLSFGQRQRISIARALLKDPAILILDEATSCVDSQTERLIMDEALGNLMRGRTTLIVSQRLSSIRQAGRIVFIEEGRVLESGSHFELLDKKGGYYRMWLSQQEGPALSFSEEGAHGKA